MGLWAQGSGQILDCTSMGNSFAALDAVIEEVIGNGVVSGLALTNPSGAEVAVSSGVAIAGHVVAYAGGNISLAAGTFDLYLCQPVFSYSGTAPVAGSYPGTNGQDAGVLTPVAHGTSPAAPGAFLGTVVSTGSGISSIVTTGRTVIPGPAPTGTRRLAPAKANVSQPSGSTSTTFTLTQTPVSDVTIFKNGLLIDPTLYSISGTTLTFGTAPSSTDTLAAGFLY